MSALTLIFLVVVALLLAATLATTLHRAGAHHGPADDFRSHAEASRSERR